MRKAALAVAASWLLMCLPVTGTGSQAPAIQASDRALLTSIAKKLDSSPVVSGHFEQRKSVRGFKNPLQSSGRFVIARSDGVTWHTTQPFESRLEVTAQGIFTRQPDGTVSALVGPGEEPAVQAINELLFAVMTADLDALAERFDVTGRLLDADRWTLDLHPRDAMLKTWLARIQLQGDTYVRSVVLHETQGDETAIRLSEHESGTRTPDAK